MYDDFGHDMQ
jgi:cilia- and flagella-associated protein 251